MVNPLEGFNGVTEVFYHIWKIARNFILKSNYLVFTLPW